jgi:hypothetical protein
MLGKRLSSDGLQAEADIPRRVALLARAAASHRGSSSFLSQQKVSKVPVDVGESIHWLKVVSVVMRVNTKNRTQMNADSTIEYILLLAPEVSTLFVSSGESRNLVLFRVADLRLRRNDDNLMPSCSSSSSSSVFT